MTENMNPDPTQAEHPVSAETQEATARIKNTEFLMDSSADAQYLLDQCDALVKDRNSWKERATEAEKLIAQLKMDKQELIRAVTKTLNQN